MGGNGDKEEARSRKSDVGGRRQKGSGGDSVKHEIGLVCIRRLFVFILINTFVWGFQVASYFFVCFAWGEIMEMETGCNGMKRSVVARGDDAARATICI